MDAPFLCASAARREAGLYQAKPLIAHLEVFMLRRRRQKAKLLTGLITGCRFVENPDEIGGRRKQKRRIDLRY